MKSKRYTGLICRKTMNLWAIMVSQLLGAHYYKSTFSYKKDACGSGMIMSGRQAYNPEGI
jgi:hypothetical protein